MSPLRGPVDLAAAPLLRRQLVLAGVAAGVTLVAVMAVAAAVSGGDAVHATLRPTGDGSFTAVSPQTGSSRTALWAAAVALVAVGAVLVVSVRQLCAIARFAAASRAGRAGQPDGSTGSDRAREVC